MCVCVCVWRFDNAQTVSNTNADTTHETVDRVLPSINAEQNADPQDTDTRCVKDKNMDFKIS